LSQRDFETRLLNLWMKTRVPMTRANLLFYTQAPRKKMGAWLDELVSDGVLEVDADPDGEMLWSVRGAKRPESGPTTLEDAGPAPSGESGDIGSRLDNLRKEALARVSGPGTALAIASGARTLLQPTKKGDKSLIASGLLSAIFGPLGWLYAAPYKVAVPASIAMLVLAYFLGWHVIGFSLIWGALGVAYAWRHNQNGKRSPLFGSADEDAPPALPRKRT
jgi:hypothetical protein